MSQQILFPGWNNFSFKQKRLVKNWIESILRLRVASKKLLNALSDISDTDEEHLSSALDDLLKNFHFEVVDSSTTSEGIRLQEIIPAILLSSQEDLRQDICRAGCILSNNNTPSCVSECIKNFPSLF